MNSGDALISSVTLLSPLTVQALFIGGLVILACYALLRWLAGPAAAVAKRQSLFVIRAMTVVTLLFILLNPSNVTQTQGPIDRPDIFYLLDASQSMAIGDKETRFDHATRLMREAKTQLADDPHANVKLFRFGHRLSAVDDLVESDGSKPGNAQIRNVSRRESTSTKPLAPTDSDTQLLTALRQASSRFGRRPPASLVLFSDGRTHDESGLEQIAAHYAGLGVPIHVVPVGDTSKGGDVAIVAVVVPPRVRRFSEVEVQVFLRSYGYDGQRCEVTLSTVNDNGPDAKKTVASVPVTLRDGFQSASLTFWTDAKTKKLRVDATTMSDEVSLANNTFNTEVTIDRTKIRVLYVEGSMQPLQTVQRGDKYEVRGPYSDVQQALAEDEDIECVVLVAPYGRANLQRIGDGNSGVARGFPDTVAELTAFDAIILSDVGVNSFTENQLTWIENWIGQRGGGLLMVGGQRSFSAGDWDDSPLAAVLPIEMRSDNDWIPGTQVSVNVGETSRNHPLWSIVGNEALNRSALDKFPSFFGANRWSGVKPNLSRVLATSNLASADAPALATVRPAAPQSESFLDVLRKNLVRSNPGGKAGTPSPTPNSGGPVSPGTGANGSDASKKDATAIDQPAIVVGQYGRGRTMAMSVPITSPWANDFLTKWGSGDTRFSSKYWRNAIYWLTEFSSVGRRRLVVATDKKFYRPGETIGLSATAFDEAARQTGTYTISGMIEPQTSLSDLESNYSPIRWPDGKARTSGESGPFVAWGEEFDLPRKDQSTDKPNFSLELPVADALTVGSASQSLRVELTAMEQFTQVDSTSIDIQILHDPFEQQNPFPNHELLTRIAKSSGGKVIASVAELSEVLRDVPMKEGAPVIKKSPIWSSWWLWCWMIGLLTAEWLCRRVVGLA